MKTYTLGCKDFGKACPFSVTSENKDEVKKLVTAHYMEAHAEEASAMSEEDKMGLDGKMDGLMHEADM
jgi:predicted small metal-binding protein